METQRLIRGLASDLETRTSPRLHGTWLRLATMTALASAISLAAILAVLSRNPHLAHGPTATVIFTALSGTALAAGAFWALLRLSFPEGRAGTAWLLVPVLILSAGIGLELSQAPRSSWSPRLWGENPVACFLWVLALSLPILVASLVALRYGAPMHPRASGAMAGLLAGGIATVLYTIHCPENSLLFIASWHGLAVLAVTLCGASAAGRYLRW